MSPTPSSAASPTSRTRAAMWGLASNYSSLGLSIVENVILVPLYLKHIDIGIYGAWLATGSIITYLGLLDFGINGVLIQGVGESYGRRDWTKLRDLLACALSALFALAPLAAALGFLAARWVPGFVKITGDDAVILTQALHIASFGAALIILMYGLGGVLTGLQRQMGHGAILFVSRCVGIITTVAFLPSKRVVALALGFTSYAAIAAAADLVLLLIVWRRLAPPGRFRVSNSGWRTLWALSLWQFASQAFARIARDSDNLIVGIVTDPKICVAYVLTKRAADVGRLVAGFFASSFLAPLAHLVGEQGRGTKNVKYVVRMIGRYCVAIAATSMVAYIWLNPHFVTLWVGPDKLVRGWPMILLGAQMGAYILATFCYNAIFSHGEIRTSAVAGIIEAVIRVGFGALFTIQWGLPGLTIALVLSTLASLLVQGGRLIEVAPLSADDLAWFGSSLLIDGAFCCAIAVTLARVITIDSWPSFFLSLLLFLATSSFFIGRMSPGGSQLKKDSTDRLRAVFSRA